MTTLFYDIPSVNLAKLPMMKEEHRSLLKANGVRNTREYLVVASTSAGRRGLHSLFGIPHEDLLYYANICDLMRVSTVGAYWADVLYCVGVVNTNLLRDRNGPRLYITIHEYFAKRGETCIQGFSSTLVFNWIRRARQLPHMIRY